MKHLLLFLFLLPATAFAQDDDYYRKNPSRRQPRREYSVLLKDGTSLRGEVISQDSVEAVIRTRNLGEVRVPVGQIVKIELRPENAPAAQPYRNEEPRRPVAETYPNLFPQTMRFVPTALMAERGKLYYRNYYLYYNQFEYGISNNWSVSAAIYPIPQLTAFSVNTKFSVPVSSRVRLGVSAQYASIQSDGFVINGSRGDFRGIGYVQGLVTTGTTQNNTTFGLGWSVSKGELSRNVIGTFGLVRKVSPKLSFISENFILFGAGANRDVDFAGFLSGGVRFDRRRHAFDLAGYVPLLFGRGGGVPFSLIPFGSYHLRIGG